MSFASKTNYSNDKNVNYDKLVEPQNSNYAYRKIKTVFSICFRSVNLTTVRRHNHHNTIALCDRRINECGAQSHLVITCGSSFTNTCMLVIAVRVGDFNIRHFCARYRVRNVRQTEITLLLFVKKCWIFCLDKFASICFWSSCSAYNSWPLRFLPAPASSCEMLSGRLQPCFGIVKQPRLTHFVYVFHAEQFVFSVLLHGCSHADSNNNTATNERIQNNLDDTKNKLFTVYRSAQLHENNWLMCQRQF